MSDLDEKTRAKIAFADEVLDIGVEGYADIRQQLGGGVAGDAQRRVVEAQRLAADRRPPAAVRCPRR